MATRNKPLYLSPWGASIPVCVPVDCAKDLKNHEIMGIRFLYSCYMKKQNGAIVNHEDGMNMMVLVSAFLSAFQNVISFDNSLLVICREENLQKWNFHLSIHGGYDVTVLSVSDVDDVLKNTKHRVILSTVDNTAALKRIKIKDFFSVIVDDLDRLVAKSITKQIKGQFNIGLTHRNFMKLPDDKLLWTMLNWSNPGAFGKFADFSDEYDEHLRNLRNPYTESWQRLTWKYCDCFKPPTEYEIKEYNSKLREWSRNCNGSESRPSTRKRKYPIPDSTKALKPEVCEVNSEMEVEQKEIDAKFLHNNSASSDDTVIYNFKDSPMEEDDDDYILSSLISGKGLSPPKTTHVDKLHLKLNDSSDEDNSILTSIVNSKSTEDTLQKKEILSLLYGDDI